MSFYGVIGSLEKQILLDAIVFSMSIAMEGFWYMVQDV